MLKGLTMLPRLLRFGVLAATVASGLAPVVNPESVSGFTGLAPDAAPAGSRRSGQPLVASSSHWG